MLTTPVTSFFFFFNDTATTEIYTLSLHDALPILIAVRSKGTRPRLAEARRGRDQWACASSGTTRTSSFPRGTSRTSGRRSEEHTSELQSPCNLVCRLLLEKKKKNSKPSSARP